MSEVLADLIGVRLRALRTAQGRTLAQVAVEAGLSVPYIANLESGRGNPTLGALAALGEALGTTIAELTEEGKQPQAPALPRGLDDFARGARFRDEVRRLSAENDLEVAEVRHRLLTAMAAVGRNAHRRFDELDWHRVLDSLVILYRRTSRR